jgi:hypothetical protein
MLWRLSLLSFVAAAQGPIHFENRASEAGVKFVLENSPTPQKHLIETMPGGVAVFDYNSDGRPDIFFTNGAALPSLEKSSAKFQNRLFRNDGNWKFTDVTGQAGLAGAGYSMGAAAADFDNDGHPDLFVAGAYRNLLYRNRGDGTFEDITGKAGINSKYWSVAAGWFDFDNDGLLDLFVVNYAKWTPAFDRFCGDAEKQIRIYCHPKYFSPVPNQLYRNLGGGRFAEISDAAGLTRRLGRGMSVVFADYDGDGFEDVFVTNDKLENSLFHNRAGKSFEEVAVAVGVALPDDGRPISGMGADFRDYNNDGLPDLILTALSGETFPLFQNLGKSQFRDATYSSKLASATRIYAGWGVGLADFDNDGWRDLFTANSHVNDLVEKFEPYVYRQPNTVFRNQHDGTFALTDSGMSLAKSAHRGSGFADFDGDGRVDIVVSALGGPAELWRNLSPPKGAWLDIRLVGKKSNRDGLGAQTRIGNQTSPMTSAVGYASSSLTPVHFGGLAEKADVEIRWPSGIRQIVKGVATSRTVTIAEE